MKRLFGHGPGPALRAFVLLSLSFFLMMVDHHVAEFHSARLQVTSVLSFPFRWTVDAPVRFAQWIDTSITSQQRLIDENAELRAHQLLLETRLQRLLSLQKENAQLRLLLQSSTQISGRTQVARLLSVNMDPHYLEVIVNKGVADKVYVGQPVMDGYGVIGQVINVGSMTSNVMLITDQRSAVPVKNERNGLRAVAEGLGLSGHLKLIDMPEDFDVQVGDIFVSSGLGLHYPVGYPVGKVIDVIKNGAGQAGMSVILTPVSHLDQDEQVLLSWPTNHLKNVITTN